MGRKFLALLGTLGTLGVISPVILKTFSAVVIMITVATIVIVFLALFNPKVLNRLIKLLTAITSSWKRKDKAKKS